MTAIAAIGEGLVELGIEPGAATLGLGYGGDAANICVMAARLGAPVRLVGRVGRDPLGTRLARFWEDAGVDVSAVRLDDAPTGLYVNETAPDGGHRFSYWRRGSAGSRVGRADLQTGLGDVTFFVATGVTLAISPSAASAAVHGAADVRARGARVVCVLNHRPELGGDLDPLHRFAAASDVVIGSREDARAVFGSGDVDAIAPSAHEVVLTDGAAPVTFRAAGRIGRCAVPPVAVRNAGGAGDAFAGAYLARRAGGDDVEEAVRWGVAAASLSVAGTGCAASYPRAAEVRALVAALSAAVGAPDASMEPSA